MTAEAAIHIAVPNRNATLLSWQERSGSRWGRWLFSRAVCRRSPYFAILRPRFAELRPALCIVMMPHRPAVCGRGGVVHPLAIATLCELAASTVAEVTVPAGMRWSSRGMTIEYLRRAESAVRATARLDKNEWAEVQNVAVPVSAVDRNGTEVVRAVITLRIEPTR